MQLKLFIFDTETSGLGNSAEILQLGIITGIFDTITGEFIREITWTNLFNIKGEIDPGAAKAHGISKEQLEGKPYLEGDILDEVIDMIKESDLIVCHNYNFDSRLLQNTIDRQSILFNLKSKKSLCTMLKSTNYCKLPKSNGGYKWAKLQELHHVLFGELFENAHDAGSDIAATLKCFLELYTRNVITEKDLLTN